MASVLFIWVMNAGVVHLEGMMTFYSLEACQTAARNAENAPLAFSDRSDVQVKAFCNTKKLSKEEK